MRIVATPAFVEIVGFLLAGPDRAELFLSRCSLDLVDHGFQCR